MVLRGKSTPLSLALDLRGDYLSNQIFIGFTAYNSLPINLCYQCVDLATAVIRICYLWWMSEWAIRLLYTLKVLIPVRNNFRVTANSLQILGINFLLNIFFPDIQIKAKEFLKINASFFQKNKKNMVIFA